MPDTLEPAPNILWRVPLARAGLGGIAANNDVLVFGDRDVDDFHDVYRCLDARSGQQLWQIERLAIAALDYGNSPRATPLIVGKRVVFCGAHGAVLCADLKTGHVVWETNLREEFGVPPELPWGYCGSPLLVDGRLIVAPGTNDAALVALNPADGSVIWKSPGISPSYGSLISGFAAGRSQIIGLDANSLGGWDAESGQRLWSVQPEVGNEFNVPTPILNGSRLLVTTENNGARLLEFGKNPESPPKLTAQNQRLRPDMSSAVLVGSRLFCAKKFLFCLNADNKLSEEWRVRDRAIGDYAAIVASRHRVLVIGNGELLLFPTDGTRDLIARQTVFEDELPIYSHPALVNGKMYLRGEAELVCLQLMPPRDD